MNTKSCLKSVGGDEYLRVLDLLNQRDREIVELKRKLTQLTTEETNNEQISGV